MTKINFVVCLIFGFCLGLLLKQLYFEPSFIASKIREIFRLLHEENIRLFLFLPEVAEGNII